MEASVPAEEAQSVLPIVVPYFLRSVLLTVASVVSATSHAVPGSSVGIPITSIKTSFLNNPKASSPLKEGTL